jgi:hypothetical protein
MHSNTKIISQNIYLEIESLITYIHGLLTRIIIFSQINPPKELETYWKCPSEGLLKFLNSTSGRCHEGVE